MIEIRNGRYAYGSFTLAMDFTLPRGAFTAVLGASGSGKSTLLNIIAGFEELQEGRILLADQDITATPPAERPVSMVFQDNNTFAHLTAWENVALGILPTLRLSEAQRATTDVALERVALTHLAKRRPGEMSGGERQRIAIARALVRDRPVLLLDEPFAALGPALRLDMLDLVRALHREKQLTTMMVTHTPEDAKRVSDHVMFVDGGRVRAPVPTTRFFLSKDDPAINDYLG